MEIIDFTNITTKDILNEVRSWRKKSQIDLINRLEGLQEGTFEIFTDNFYIHFDYYFTNREGGVISEILTVIDLECTDYKFSREERKELDSIVFNHS